MIRGIFNRILSSATAIVLLMALSPSKSLASYAMSSLPRNSLYFPAVGPAANGMTEGEFNSILKKIRSRHLHFFTEMNSKLRIKSDWVDGTVNAFADRDWDVYIIEVYGGLARHPSLSRDGFALLVCHEMGHHLGGAPTGLDSGWPSIEGQSDYFSTLKCLRRIFADEDNEAAIAGQAIDQVMREKCERVYSNRQDQLVCLRSSLAALSAARLIHELVGEGPIPQFSTPDQRVVKETDTEHPVAQCRLDTYVAGLLCPVSAEKNPGLHDPTQNTCIEGRDLEGFRPRCWYRP